MNDPAPVLAASPSQGPPSELAAALPAGPLTGRGLVCKRGRRLLFAGLDIALDPGTVTWLRGTNGSGKTSLLRILAGLSAPSGGEVLWGGEPRSRAGDAARAGTLYIGHANALKDDLTLDEALAFLARLANCDDPAGRSARALEQAGLGPQRRLPVRHLSQGQRRRGALARLALDDVPRNWILDEPFDALDGESTERLSDLVARHAGRGGAVLLTSHQAVKLAGLRIRDLTPPTRE